MSDDHAAAELAAAIDARVAERVERARRRRAERQQARAEQQRRRAAGLRARHARKLARDRGDQP